MLADVLSRAPAEECDSGSQDQVGRLVAAVTEAHAGTVKERGE